MTATAPLTTSCKRNGTHLRVLIATPTDQINTILVDRLADDLAVHLARLVVLAAPSVDDLDRHTERLQQSARLVSWELVAADGMHAQIICALANRNGDSA